MMIGSEAYLNDVYAQYWELIQTNPDEHVAPTMASALEKMVEPGYFLYTVSPHMLTDVYRELNDPRLDLTTVTVGNWPSQMPLRKNSPLTKMFNQGMGHNRDNRLCRRSR